MSAVAINRIKEYPLAVCAFLIVVAAGVLLFLRADRVTLLEAELSTARTTINRMEANLRESADLEEDKERLLRLRDQIDSRLMAREEVAFNLDYFYRLEATHTVRIENLRPLGGRAGPSDVVPPVDLFDVLGFDLTVRGEFANVNEFIRTLESDHYFGRVESLSITRPAGAGSNTVTAQIALNLLGRKP
ncbi:MAG: hypothetical protein JJT96_03100 [Opitutales bacterium]|nr:hypothetical protein [Opitutales bacterium]